MSRTKKKTDDASTATDQEPVSDVVTEAPQSDVNGSGEAPEKSNGRKPVASWRFPVDKGTNVQVALWPNTIQLQSGEEIEILSMTISRSYKDKNGDWVNSRSSFSFRVHELPVLQHAISQAYEHAMNQRQLDSPF